MPTARQLVLVPLGALVFLAPTLLALGHHAATAKAPDVQPPLVQTVKRWWFEADAWRDPQAQREFLARIDSYRDIGPPPADQRMSRDEIRTQFGV